MVPRPTQSPSTIEPAYRRRAGSQDKQLAGPSWLYCPLPPVEVTTEDGQSTALGMARPRCYLTPIPRPVSRSPFSDSWGTLTVTLSLSPGSHIQLKTLPTTCKDKAALSHMHRLRRPRQSGSANTLISSHLVSSLHIFVVSQRSIFL